MISVEMFANLQMATTYMYVTVSIHNEVKGK